MKRLVFVACVAALLSACSSVKLDDVPVEDRNATTTGTGSGATDGRGVTQVDLGKNNLDSIMKGTSRIVYFDFDSYAIRPEFQSVIEAHARYLRDNKNQKVGIEGHTDERGGREYNLALGQKRAEAVRRALAVQGVSDGQMEAVSFGKEKPAEQGNSEAAMAKNRRAEISYR